MDELIFLKLGGSLLTDKLGEESLRAAVLTRLAGEIRSAREERPGLRLVIGHGSGSFGHVAAARHNTQDGVVSPPGWRGFAHVSDAAARLNRTVCAALLEAGVPALSLQPSASARCVDGALTKMASAPVRLALAGGLVPLLYGDVAFDTVRGGTIISTESVLGYLAGILQPSWLLLAGDTPGVHDQAGEVVPRVTRANRDRFAAALAGSRGTDVTGGMAGKVDAMLDLTAANPGLTARIFSGLEEGRLRHALLRPGEGPGTTIRAAGVHAPK